MYNSSKKYINLMVWFDSNIIVVNLISENYVIEIKRETTLFLNVSWLEILVISILENHDSLIDNLLNWVKMRSHLQ